MEDVDRFVTAARAFLEFTHTAAELELQVRLRTGRDRLLALYTAAVALPGPWDVGADRDAKQGPEVAVTPVDFGKHTSTTRCSILT